MILNVLEQKQQFWLFFYILMLVVSVNKGVATSSDPQVLGDGQLFAPVFLRLDCLRSEFSTSACSVVA